MLMSVVEERAIERGKEIGKKIGKEIGKEIGEKIGKEIGKNERALAVASRMLDAGEPCEKILDYTGITSEELDRLVANRRN